MIFGENFKRKYALSDKGVSNTKKGMFWTIIVNLVVMGGMGILYFLMERFMKAHTGGEALPKTAFFIALILGFAVLSLFTHIQQYRSTYGLVYGEIKVM